MTNFFEQASDNAKALEEKLLGPSYKYGDYINSPEEMGMSSSGSISAISSNIAGLIGYVTVLSSGGGQASKISGPLGNSFFLKTGAQCKDKASGELVTRSIYVNNIPDGSIPFITSGLGVKMTAFKGLIPGTMSNLAQINPMQIFGSFMEGTNPECEAITLPTRNSDNITSMETAYVTKSDIKAIEGFTTIDKYNKRYIKNNNRERKFNYGKMPNDTMVKLYYSSLTLLVLYIFLKMFKK
jgi:hypothetical protein